MNRKIIVAVSGASRAIYASVLFNLFDVVSPEPSGAR